MPYDETVAATIRAALGGRDDITEKKMFGGLCFLLNGNMLCGAYRGGGMVRVGKANANEALSLPHVRPMTMTGRPMPGIVEVDGEAFADPALRDRLMRLAFDFVEPLPAK